MELVKTGGNVQSYGGALHINFLVAAQIFQPTDIETEGNAFETTQVLINTIYNASAEDLRESEEIEGLAKEICEECLDVLREPEKSQAKPAVKVIGTLAGSARTHSNIISPSPSRLSRRISPSNCRTVCLGTRCPLFNWAV